jgi:hypothetical protein
VRIEQWNGALACHLQSATGMTNERFAGWLGIATRTVAYWHSKPDTIPGNPNQEILDAALDRLSDAIRAVFLDRVKASSADGGATSSDAIASAIASTADTVACDPLLLGLTDRVDSAESLQGEVAILARSSSMAAFDVFSSARRLRDEAHRQAEKTRRPAVLSDLYAVIGQATSLMASTAFDLGHWNESAALARASTQYADLAGHASLKAWTYGLQVTLANWRNEPDAAIDYFERGMTEAPAGEPRLRLRYIAARSYALLGDERTVADLIASAEHDRDDATGRTDELSGSIGGEFAFGEARAAACAAAGWLDLHNGEEAAKHAEIALASFESLPPARRPYSQINGTLIDIAAARLLMMDLDGAIATLRPVLSLPPAKRNVSLTGRFARVRNYLFEPGGDKDPQACQLRDEISQWLAETSAQPLT